MKSREFWIEKVPCWHDMGPQRGEGLFETQAGAALAYLHAMMVPSLSCCGVCVNKTGDYKLLLLMDKILHQ